MRLNLCGGVVAGLCLVAASASAATIASYDLGTVDYDTGYCYETTWDARVTASALTVTTYMSGGRPYTVFQQINSVPGRLTVEDYVPSLDKTKGFKWTITPNADSQMTLTAVTFGFTSASGYDDFYDPIHGPNQLEMYSSRDNISTAIYTQSSTLGNHTYTANLSGFNNLSSPVTFYIFAYGGNNEYNPLTFGLRTSLSVTGTTSAVPEPSIVAALGAVLMPMLARRQRRVIGK
jgi:hypothetical protein